MSHQCCYIYNIHTHTHCNHEKSQQLKKQPPFTIFKCEVHMIQTCLQLTHSPYWMEMCHIAPQSTATQRAPVTHSYILHPFCRLHVIRPPPHKLTSLKSPRLSWDFCTGVEARGVRGEVSPCPLSSCILWSKEVGPAKSSLHVLPLRKMVVEGVALGLYLFFFLTLRAFKSFRKGVGNLTSWKVKGERLLRFATIWARVPCQLVRQRYQLFSVWLECSRVINVAMLRHHWAGCNMLSYHTVKDQNNTLVALIPGDYAQAHSTYSSLITSNVQ